MRKKYSVMFVCALLVCLNISASDLLTRAERTDYQETSTYADVMELIYRVQEMSPGIRMKKLTSSTEERMIPLVMVSRRGIGSVKEAGMLNLPSVLIMANIHAGEVEGKEATLMLLREFSQNKLDHLLKNQVVLIIPIFNPDGNERMSERNRRDNGPKKAGIRANGQSLDLNRDYMKMESPEIRGLVALFNHWDPVLVVDMHTTNGSWHRNPVTYSTLASPNSDHRLINYMWQSFFPAVSRTLKNKYKYDSIPYGNFVNRLKPEEGWRSHAFNPMYGSNYVGLRNRFCVLDENYSHADFKTRVLSSLGFIKSILEYTNEHIGEMAELTRQADIRTAGNYWKTDFVKKFNNEKLMDITIKSYEFVNEKIKPEDRNKYPPWIKDYVAKKTDRFKDYTVPYFSRAVGTETANLPAGYVLFPRHREVIKILKGHGIVIEKLLSPHKCVVEQYHFSELKPSDRFYQGRMMVSPSGEYQQIELVLDEGACYVTMKQPLARLVAELLEPEAPSSLLRWGFFNRSVFPQWSRQLNPYPVFRVMSDDFSPRCIQE